MVFIELHNRIQDNYKNICIETVMRANKMYLASSTFPHRMNPNTSLVNQLKCEKICSSLSINQFWMILKALALNLK
jgi:hypothetical protein